jgi:hypothetical protein
MSSSKEIDVPLRVLRRSPPSPSRMFMLVKSACHISKRVTCQATDEVVVCLADRLGSSAFSNVRAINLAYCAVVGKSELDS